MQRRHSRLQAFKRCLWAYTAEYICGIVPIKPSGNLFAGTLIHAGLEAARHAQFNGESHDNIVLAGAAGVEKFFHDWSETVDGTIALQVEETSEQLTQLVGECAMTASRVAKGIGLADGRYRTLTDRKGIPIIEYEIEHANYGGRIDWAFEDLQDGTFWLSDDKTRDSFQSVENAELDMQLPVYQNLLVMREGITLSGTSYLQIRRGVPREPKVNKDGSISRSSITTDWETYSAVVLREGQDPEQYLDMLPKMSKWWEWLRVYRTPAHVWRVWWDIDTAGNAVEEFEHRYSFMEKHTIPTGMAYRSMSAFNCSGCQYRDLCIADLHGGDTDALLETLYRIRKEP